MAATKMSLSSQVLSNTKSYLQVNPNDSLPVKGSKTLGGATITLPLAIAAGAEGISSKVIQLISKPIASENTNNALAGRATDALSTMYEALTTLGGAWYKEPKRMDSEPVKQPQNWSSTLWNHKGKIGLTVGLLTLAGAYAYQNGYFPSGNAPGQVLTENGKNALAWNAGLFVSVLAVLCCVCA